MLRAAPAAWRARRGGGVDPGGECLLAPAPAVILSRFRVCVSSLGAAAAAAYSLSRGSSSTMCYLNAPFANVIEMKECPREILPSRLFHTLAVCLPTCCTIAKYFTCFSDAREMSILFFFLYKSAASSPPWILFPSIKPRSEGVMVIFRIDLRNF